MYIALSIQRKDEKDNGVRISGGKITRFEHPPLTTEHILALAEANKTFFVFDEEVEKIVPIGEVRARFEQRINRGLGLDDEEPDRLPGGDQVPPSLGNGDNDMTELLEATPENKKKLLEVDHPDLFAEGTKLGISAESIIALISLVGPKVAEIVITLWKKKQNDNVDPKLGASLGGLASLISPKALLVELLINQRDRIMGLLDQAENALFDLIIAKLSA